MPIWTMYNYVISRRMYIQQERKKKELGLAVEASCDFFYHCQWSLDNHILDFDLKKWQMMHSILSAKIYETEEE